MITNVEAIFINPDTLVRVVCLNGGIPSEPCTFEAFVRANPCDASAASHALARGQRYPVIAGALELEVAS